MPPYVRSLEFDLIRWSNNVPVSLCIQFENSWLILALRVLQNQVDRPKKTNNNISIKFLLVNFKTTRHDRKPGNLKSWMTLMKCYQDRESGACSQKLDYFCVTNLTSFIPHGCLVMQNHFSPFLIE